MEKYHIPGFLLLLYIYLTQSRGPMIATAAGYMILQIVRFKNIRVATCTIAVLLAAGAFSASSYFSHYAEAPSPGSVMTEQQGSAVYRKQMNELYKPINEQGGWLGWSYLSHPVVPGMFSTDNEFLLIRLAQGRLGYILLVLIAFESIRRLVTYSWKSASQEESAFAVSMLAAMVILWVSVLTVYLGEQLPQLAFLLIGWGQSLSPTSMDISLPNELRKPAKFAFRRVFS
jgi:hypothetical protein